jgi:hypothetical protein
MNEQPTTGTTSVVEAVGRPRGRRWLFGALGGALAGFTASKLGAPATANAEDGGELHLGQNNSATLTTKITMGDGGDQVGFQVEHLAFPEFAAGNTAISGIGLGTLGAGVSGLNSSGPGVRGKGSTGVDGHSDDGVGVTGSTFGSGGPVLFPAAGGSFATFASNSIGLHAVIREPLIGDPPTNSIALLVEAIAGNTAARFEGPVQFLGIMQVNGDIDLDGLLEVTAAPGSAAARFIGATEVQGTLVATAAPGGTAARFVGAAEFDNDVTVGGAILQSITPAGGGAPVQSHAIQALSPMIEHVGEVAMAGQATLRVDLPAAFLAVANTSAYFVQVTGIGGDNPQVSSKDATGFNLKAQNANKAPNSVCFRVVAPRL